jgi:hypothetical protein
MIKMFMVLGFYQVDEFIDKACAGVVFHMMMGTFAQKGIVGSIAEITYMIRDLPGIRGGVTAEVYRLTESVGESIKGTDDDRGVEIHGFHEGGVGCPAG